VIPAGWWQEGHPATKTLHQFPFIQHGTQWSTSVVKNYSPFHNVVLCQNVGRYPHVPVDPDDLPIRPSLKPPYPYQTIGCIFNHEYFFANAQVTCVMFWRSLFCSGAVNAVYCFVIETCFMLNDCWYQQCWQLCDHCTELLTEWIHFNVICV